MYCSHQYLSIDKKKSLPRPLKRPQIAQACDAHNVHLTSHAHSKAHNA